MTDSDRIVALEARLAAAEGRIAALESRLSQGWPTPLVPQISAPQQPVWPWYPTTCQRDRR